MAVTIRKSKHAAALVVRGASSMSAVAKPDKSLGDGKAGAVNALPANGCDKKKKQGHAKPLTVTLDLHQPGRLRVGHLMNLLSISHAGFYARLKRSEIPRPDGKDGKRSYWNTSTILPLLK